LFRAEYAILLKLKKEKSTDRLCFHGFLFSVYR
jgi:hypothetical protein